MPAARVLEMPESLAALLPKARRKPLALRQNGKTAAFLVSARDDEKMADAAEFESNFDGELSKEEERVLAKRADDAMKAGTIGVRASRKLHEDVRRAAAARRAKPSSRKI